MVVITPWMVAGQLLGMLAYTVAWLRGGHPERFAAAVFLYGNLISSITFRWKIGGYHVASVIQEVVLMLIFVALALRSRRWWPFMTAATLVLVVLVNLVPLMNPALSGRPVASAQVGLWFLIDLTVLIGVFERWLTGERAVSPRRFGEARDRALASAKRRR